MALALLLGATAACNEVEAEVLPLIFFGTLETGHPYRIEIVRRPRAPGSVVEVQLFVEADRVTLASAGAQFPAAYMLVSPDPEAGASMLRPNHFDDSVSRGEAMLFEFREPPRVPSGPGSLSFDLPYIEVDGQNLPRGPESVRFDTTRIPTAPR